MIHRSFALTSLIVGLAVFGIGTTASAQLPVHLRGVHGRGFRPTRPVSPRPPITGIGGVPIGGGFSGGGSGGGFGGGSTEPVSPTDKAKSDALMQEALAYLQKADSELHAGNTGAVESLRAADYDMWTALPHYDRHRDSAIKHTENAGRILYEHRPDSVQRAIRPTENAITDVQKALSYW